MPDHSWLSRTRSRLPLELHDQVFSWVLHRLAEHGLIRGERIGVDASTMEANAALRSIVRRDSGEGYREMLTRMAKESGIATPTADDLVRLDRARAGKKLSNADWESPIDPDARIAKLKDGRTRLAYKPEHALDLDTGAIIAAELHTADQGDTASLPGTLEAAAEQLAALDALPTQEAPAELIADKGYHSRETLKSLADGPWKTRVSERRIDGVLRWHGDHAARRAVYNNRARLRSSVARGVFRLRAEWLERSFALILDRGGMRRTWLRGRENIHKRYLIHVAGYNLGLIMRLLTGAGTPRQLHARASAYLFALITPDARFSLSLSSPSTASWQSQASLSRQTRPTGLWISQRAVKGSREMQAQGIWPQRLIRFITDLDHPGETVPTRETRKASPTRDGIPPSSKVGLKAMRDIDPYRADREAYATGYESRLRVGCRSVIERRRLHPRLLGQFAA